MLSRCTRENRMLRSRFIRMFQITIWFDRMLNRFLRLFLEL